MVISSTKRTYIWGENPGSFQLTTLQLDSPTTCLKWTKHSGSSYTATPSKNLLSTSLAAHLRKTLHKALAPIILPLPTPPSPPNLSSLRPPGLECFKGHLLSPTLQAMSLPFPHWEGPPPHPLHLSVLNSNLTSSLMIAYGACLFCLTLIRVTILYSFGEVFDCFCSSRFKFKADITTALSRSTFCLLCLKQSFKWFLPGNCRIKPSLTHGRHLKNIWEIKVWEKVNIQWIFLYDFIVSMHQSKFP